jgi:hypothetical protein
MKDLMKMFPPPGHEPEFFSEDQVDIEHCPEPMTTCIFCLRPHDQVPHLVISGAQGCAICSECIEELNAVLRGPDAYQAWYEERRRKFEKEIGPNP